MKKEIKQENGTITIKGNNHWRPVLFSCALTPKEAVEVSEMTDEWEKLSYVRYKGNIYCLNDFMWFHNEIYFPNPPEWTKEYDGQLSDSHFSGLLIRVSEDFELCQIFTYMS